MVETLISIILTNPYGYSSEFRRNTRAAPPTASSWRGAHGPRKHGSRGGLVSSRTTLVLAAGRHPIAGGNRQSGCPELLWRCYPLEASVGSFLLLALRHYLPWL